MIRIALAALAGLLEIARTKNPAGVAAAFAKLSETADTIERREAMKTVAWKLEPKGPGRAFHMFLDAAGERVELLAYDCAASHGCPRMCGFEIYVRERSGRPFHNQVAAGEADSLENAMRAAREMVARPRAMWSVLPRSWVALT